MDRGSQSGRYRSSDDRNFAELGVNRLSLGSQSFQSEKLRLLERDHAPADIRGSVDLARSVRMQVSLDLIFAAPAKLLQTGAADLEAAIALKPDHISAYGLTFEQGTPFWNRKLHRRWLKPTKNCSADMYALAIDLLTSAGFEHYEVSNFARPGCLSRHNQVYWSGDGYFAAGPGAARLRRRRSRNKPAQHDGLLKKRTSERIGRCRSRNPFARSTRPGIAGVQFAAT